MPTILPEPPRPKDAKSVEKPGRRAILAALEFFILSWLLRTPPYRLVMVNRIEFSAEPTDTYLMHVQYVRSFIAHVAFA